ncbi:hypothetical protein Y1Q_0008133 [Alligator mississippiensis]|uniref:Uncharacterized protein n=1 Tax=Alligator mississippiensis TaxID=8496 RepID=A0A151N6E1_ALLMI|nr:hypothetical protein Y1Q_0008133 [Alligator mississippiensis]
MRGHQRDSAFLGQAVRQAHACHRAGVTAGLGEEENPSTVQSIFHLMPAPCKSKLQSRSYKRALRMNFSLLFMLEGYKL